MEQLLFAGAVLACPVGMGLMMWLMMRKPSSQEPSPQEQELRHLRAEVEELRSAQRDKALADTPRDER